jgi:hypothetical protein
MKNPTAKKPTAKKPTTPTAKNPTTHQRGAPRLKVADLLARKLELDAELGPINAALGILAGVSATPKRGRPASPLMRVAGIDAGTYAVLEIVRACAGQEATALGMIAAHPEVARSARQRLCAALKAGYLTKLGPGSSNQERYRLTPKFAALQGRLQGGE